MTIKDQIELLVSALEPWAKSRGGRVFVASDPVHAVEELRSKPGTPTAAVLFTAEDSYGEYPEEGQVKRAIKVVVSRGRGMHLVSGDSLTRGTAGGAPMFILVEEAREMVLAVRLTDQQGEMQIPEYGGTMLWEVQGWLLDAYEIRVGLFATIPRQQQ